MIQIESATIGLKCEIWKQTWSPDFASSRDIQMNFIDNSTTKIP